MNALVTSRNHSVHHLFAYGTLMCEDIMEAVSGFRPPSSVATLQGFSRYAVKDAHYPVIVPDGTGRVEGVVYRSVPDSAWARLDNFEGGMYARQSVQIEQRNGVILRAAAYVLVPNYRRLLKNTRWDFDNFMREGIQYYTGHRLRSGKNRPG